MSKYNSRKFIITLILTGAFIVFESLAVLYGFKNKDWNPALKMAPFLVYTAGLYVGGNVVQDFAFKGQKSEKE